MIWVEGGRWMSWNLWIHVWDWKMHVTKTVMRRIDDLHQIQIEAETKNSTKEWRKIWSTVTDQHIKYETIKKTGCGADFRVFVAIIFLHSKLISFFWPLSRGGYGKGLDPSGLTWEKFQMYGNLVHLMLGLLGCWGESWDFCLFCWRFMSFGSMGGY